MDKEIIEAATALGRLLKVAGMTVSTAESCTGGGIAAAMTEIPGSSDWFMGGFVTYANEWKSARLGVRETTLAEHGAVSSQTVSEMLEDCLNAGGPIWEWLSAESQDPAVVSPENLLELFLSVWPAGNGRMSDGLILMETGQEYAEKQCLRLWKCSESISDVGKVKSRRCFISCAIAYYRLC